MSEVIENLRNNYGSQLNSLIAKEQALKAELDSTKDAIAQFRGALQALDQVKQQQGALDQAGKKGATPATPDLKVVGSETKKATKAEKKEKTATEAPAPETQPN